MTQVTDRSVRPRNTVTLNQKREQIAAANTVRVYNCAPGHISLQLRAVKSYTTIVLSYEEAEQVLRNLQLTLPERIGVED
jgi:hypothetical protein